jgi:hypothetical protein
MWSIIAQVGLVIAFTVVTVDDAIETVHRASELLRASCQVKRDSEKVPQAPPPSPPR